MKEIDTDLLDEAVSAAKYAMFWDLAQRPWWHWLIVVVLPYALVMAGYAIFV